MDGDKRRAAILELLKENGQAISGTGLAEKLGVSRQIIVQDIALLRAVNKNILSTNKGYILFQETGQKNKIKRSFKIKHEEEDILEELYLVVDLGGRFVDVVVEHPIYGQITVDLIINNRKDAEKFVEQVKANRTKPLHELTDGVHYHTIEADSIETLDEIERELMQKGFLIIS